MSGMANVGVTVRPVCDPRTLRSQPRSRVYLASLRAPPPSDWSSPSDRRHLRMPTGHCAHVLPPSGFGVIHIHLIFPYLFALIFL